MLTYNDTPSVQPMRRYQRRRRYAYAWARSQADANRGAAMSADRFPRYATIADAYAAQERGFDGFQGEGLFRVAMDTRR